MMEYEKLKIQCFNLKSCNEEFKWTDGPTHNFDVQNILTVPDGTGVVLLILLVRPIVNGMRPGLER